MGLDQYAFATKGDDKQEIMYWRKHANLEGYMADLYAYRGGSKKEFNCESLELDLTDLEKLEDECGSFRGLREANGFFWGVSDDEHDKETLDFIKKAKKYIQDGYKISYTSWW
jgi:hypothetical protein